MFVTLIPYLFSTFALLLTGYLVYRAESREDVQGVASRLAKLEITQSVQDSQQAVINTSIARLLKLEIEQANQIARQTGFQTEIENVADYGKRERVLMMENIKRDHDSIRESIKDVPTMRELVYRMVERLENMKETNIKLDSKMDRIVEILTHNK